VSLKSIELNRFGRAIAFMCIDQNHVLLFRLQVVSAIALPNLASSGKVIFPGNNCSKLPHSGLVVCWACSAAWG
jgi:hypothetical protein